ncbi:MAG: hypothetical protein RL764_1348 [Pseudomonadota bacterium]
MALGPRLDLRQSQSLVMTPQLQQAIKLLALSNLEIDAFIAEEVERNPLLDAERDGPDLPAQDSADEDWHELSGEDGDDPVTTEQLIEADTGPDSDGPLDVDYASETFHHNSAADGGPGRDGALGVNGALGSFDEDGPDFENFAADGLSLHTYLMQQAGATLSGPELLLAGHIIAQIDESGYLLAPLADIAQQLGTPPAACEAVLQQIQSFDPTGVGARSLAECIALQAKEADRYDPAMARLLDNLDLLALGRLPQLKRICGVDDEDLADMIRELRSYNPKPGLRFGGEAAHSLTPDIFVSRRGAGWAVEINSASLPRLLVNRSYYTELLTSSADRKSRAWLNECLTSANWLIKTLDQRQRTILKVATELVRQQDGFFATVSAS